MKRHCRARRGGGDQRGFTVVEMVTCVVLMGIVVAPLALAVSQAINLVPEDRARSEAAIDRSLVLNRFSDDLANASGFFWNVLPVPGEHVHACPATGAGPVHLFVPVWEGNAAIYTATFVPTGGTTTRVEVNRAPFSGGAAGTDSTVLTGYCDPADGAPPIDVHRVAPDVSGEVGTLPSEYERLRVILRLRSQPDDAVEVTNFEAMLRVSA